MLLQWKYRGDLCTAVTQNGLLIITIILMMIIIDLDNEAFSVREDGATAWFAETQWMRMTKNRFVWQNLGFPSTSSKASNVPCGLETPHIPLHSIVRSCRSTHHIFLHRKARENFHMCTCISKDTEVNSRPPLCLRGYGLKYWATTAF